MSLVRVQPWEPKFGEVAEWLNAPVLKTGKRENVSRVQIPPSPPSFKRKNIMSGVSLINYKNFCLIYNFWRPELTWPLLVSSKDLFLKEKGKPFGKRKLTVVIDVSFEGESNSQNDTFLAGWGNYWTELNSLLSEYDSENIILVSNDANISKKYTEWLRLHNVKRVFGRCVYRPQTLLDRSIAHFENTPTQSKKSFKSKHFICMNGAAKPHRFHMVETLYSNDWHHKGHITYLNRYGENTKHMANENFQGQTLKLDFDAKTIDEDDNQLILPPEYREACFDIVTESIVCDTSLHITEKVWKPILHEKPFIILGPKFAHNHLLDHFGIKPYPDLFNYEFDCLGYPEKLHSIKEENLDRLLNMNINELNDIVNSDSMKEQMAYNKAQLLAYSKSEHDGDKIPIEKYLY